jgi:hypothetical protein
MQRNGAAILWHKACRSGCIADGTGAAVAKHLTMTVLSERVARGDRSKSAWHEADTALILAVFSVDSTHETVQARYSGTERGQTYIVRIRVGRTLTGGPMWQNGSCSPVDGTCTH